MLKLNIVCVGNLKEKFWKEACSEYQKRLQRFCNVKIIELAEQNKYDIVSKVLEEEGKEILASISGSCILLDIQGEEVSSEKLSTKLRNLEQNSSEITFVIGGSNGVSETVKNKIKDKVSFGKITLPHNLARVVLLEQIYRAYMINSGSKYHK